MYASTSSSMSSVVMPGFTKVRRRSMTPARMWPARRMRAISRADLSTITGGLPPRRGSCRGWRRPGPRPTPSRAGSAGGSNPAAAPSAAGRPRDGVGLPDGAAKSVDDEAGPRTPRAEPLAGQPEDHVVGDQRAAIHVALGGESQGRSRRHRLAQNVAGREMEDVPFPGELARLGALAGARRSEEPDAHAQLRANAPERDLDFFRKPS